MVKYSANLKRNQKPRLKINMTKEQPNPHQDITHNDINDFFEHKSAQNEVREFFNRITSFPVSSQKFISDLSNIFLEKDVYDSVKQDPSKLDHIKRELTQQGLGDEDINVVMKYFNLIPTPSRMIVEDKD